MLELVYHSFVRAILRNAHVQDCLSETEIQCRDLLSGALEVSDKSSTKRFEKTFE